jgi:hypothetical protein
MTIQEMLDDIEDEIEAVGIKKTWDRFTLLNWASSELNKLSSEVDHDVFYVNLDPIAYTMKDTRSYDLPDNFGINFAPNSGPDGGKFCCKISDGNTQAPLTFVSAARFFIKDFKSETASRPVEYTITTLPNGKKQIALFPKPDTAYEISGLYKPTSWELATMDSGSPVPANAAVLKYSVLRRVGPKLWTDDYMQARQAFLMELARGRVSKLVPDFSGNRYGDF